MSFFLKKEKNTDKDENLELSYTDNDNKKTFSPGRKTVYQILKNLNIGIDVW